MSGDSGRVLDHVVLESTIGVCIPFELIGWHLYTFMPLQSRSSTKLQSPILSGCRSAIVPASSPHPSKPPLSSALHPPLLPILHLPPPPTSKSVPQHQAPQMTLQPPPCQLSDTHRHTSASLRRVDSLQPHPYNMYPYQSNSILRPQSQYMPAQRPSAHPMYAPVTIVTGHFCQGRSLWWIRSQPFSCSCGGGWGACGL